MCPARATAAATVRLSHGSGRLSTAAPTAEQAADKKTASCMLTSCVTKPWAEAKSKLASAALVPARKKARVPAWLCEAHRLVRRRQASSLSNLTQKDTQCPRHDADCLYLIAVVQPPVSLTEAPANNVCKAVSCVSKRRQVRHILMPLDGVQVSASPEVAGMNFI